MIDIDAGLPQFIASRNAFSEWIRKYTVERVGIVYCGLCAIARIKSQGRVNISHFRRIRVRTPDLAPGALFTCQVTDVQNSLVWMRVVVLDDTTCSIPN